MAGAGSPSRPRRPPRRPARPPAGEELLAKAGARELPRRAAAPARGRARGSSRRSTASRGSSTTPATSTRATAARCSTGSRPTSTAPTTAAPSIRCCSVSSTVVRELALPRDPFLRLLEANRRDQEVSRYATWDELAGYCDLSANPVGELVLRVFGVADAGADRAGRTPSAPGCSWPSTGRTSARTSRAAGIYLPDEDMARFGVGEDDVRRGATPSAAFRELMAFEVERARGLLGDGVPLVASLAGRCTARDRRLRRRRPGGARRGRALRVRRARDAVPRADGRARVVATSARAAGGAMTSGRGGVRHCREVTRASATSFYHGMRLLPQRRGAARCTRSTRSRGGSTTSPTGRCRPRRSSSGARARHARTLPRSTRPRRPCARRARRRVCALSRSRGGVLRSDRRRGDGRGGHASTRRSTISSSTAGVSAGRSGGSRSACSVASDKGAGAMASRTTSASRSS